MSKVFKIALAGNPNCGKTTIFNLLTGAHQHVGNYSGVTVERKSGRAKFGEFPCEVVDLPGVYSLSSSSPEEKVAFHELLDNDIDLVLNVIDSGNAQRNLYLTTQLAELGIPMLLVFNMADDARARGIHFDLPLLSHYFGAPIVETVGADGKGIPALREAVADRLKETPMTPPAQMRYGKTADALIDELAVEVSRLAPERLRKIPARCLAIKLIESENGIVSLTEFSPLLARLKDIRKLLLSRYGMTGESYMADRRYGAIAGACREAIKITQEKRRQISDQIDRIVTNRFLGIPIFLLMMYLVFFFTFTCAEPFMVALQWLFDSFGTAINALWPTGRAELLRALLVDGVLGGVGGVLIFLPNILLLFMALAVLEGTGYMSRAAFVMDGFMHCFGLHGKSFIAMLLGFGCSVPAIMATRTIESEKDRLTTMMVIPFFSCGARLPIYALIIPVFFAERYRALMMLLIYVIGVIVALIAARVLKSTLFSGEDEVFLMELPPYRMPTVRSILIHLWERTTMYLKKAGTLILLASVILFVLNTFPVKKELSRNYQAEIGQLETNPTLTEKERERGIADLSAAQRAELLEYSAAGRIGKAMAVVLRPIGFDWKVSSALIGAAAAKELFVSQLGILYSIGEADQDGADHLRLQLAKNYTPLQGFCIMLFCLLTFPCIATLAVLRRESNSWKLTLIELVGTTAVAYVITLLVHSIGGILRIGTTLIG